MTTYHGTIAEDLKRAKKILEKGKEPRVGSSARYGSPAGTIYGADIYAAYKLLESFVAEIERLRNTSTQLATALETLRDWRYKQPKKLDEALTWRANDEAVQALVNGALMNGAIGVALKESTKEQGTDEDR